MPRVYLDHNASSPLRPAARDAIARLLHSPPANPGSVHAEGHRARMILEGVREEVAALLGAPPDSIVLTGGGTESNNLAIFGAIASSPAGRRRIVTTAFEHPSVRAIMDELERLGDEIIRVRPSRSGIVTAEAVLNAAGDDATLVSIMLANNEIGTLQPVAAVGRALAGRATILHCDAAQAAGKVPIDVETLGVDLLSIAGHKFGGPQGVGALFVRSGTSLRPHLLGGGQELNRRPGSENVAALAGLGAAATAARDDLEAEAARIGSLRDELERRLLVSEPDAVVHGADALRVPNTSCLSFGGVTGEGLVIALDLEGIAVSAGSACSAGTIRKSESLEAMGLDRESRAAIRISLGHTTTRGEIESVAATLPGVLARLRGPAAVSTGAERS